jgi:hypothetical protein
MTRFINAHTVSSFDKKKAQPTALLNHLGRVIACAWIDIDATDQSAVWVLET